MAGFDAAARKAIAVGLVSGAVALVLGISGWRTAGHIHAGHSHSDNVGLVRPKEGKA
jgi:hypothetical protein